MKYGKFKTFLLLLVASAFMSPVAHPQDKAKPGTEPDEDYKVVCRYRIISVDVEVRDSYSIEVTDLTKDNFTIYEDGEKQELIAFKRLESLEGNQPHTRYEVAYYFNSMKPDGYRKVRVVVQVEGKPGLKVKFSPKRYYATKDN